MEDKLVVYIVHERSECHSDDYEIVGVFSDEAGAQAFSREKYGDDRWVERHEVQ